MGTPGPKFTDLGPNVQQGHNGRTTNVPNFVPFRQPESVTDVTDRKQ